MKRSYWILLSASLALAAPFAFAADTWEEKVKGETGQYLVKVEPKKVEVSKVDSPDGPPHMRLKILRKNDRPLEIRLHTINLPDGPPHYAGKLDRWNDSYVGFELEFSFDKKTWKKIGQKARMTVR